MSANDDNGAALDNGATLERVTQLLGASGLAPHDEELRQLVTGYSALRRLIESLYEPLEGEP